MCVSLYHFYDSFRIEPNLAILIVWPATGGDDTKISPSPPPPWPRVTTNGLELTHRRRPTVDNLIVNGLSLRLIVEVSLTKRYRNKTKITPPHRVTTDPGTLGPAREWERALPVGYTVGDRLFLSFSFSFSHRLSLSVSAHHQVPSTSLSSSSLGNKQSTQSHAIGLQFDKT